MGGRRLPRTIRRALIINACRRGHPTVPPDHLDYGGLSLKTLTLNLLRASLLATTLLLSSAQFTPAQAQERAYAPERLWTLSVAEQRRVIGLEYSDQSNGRRIPEDQMRFYLDQVSQSRWTFSQVKNDIAESLGGSGGYPPSQGGSTIRCESTDKRQKNCPTPWQNESRLVRQLSGTPCVEGRNWSSSPGRVWVSGGCRAEFAESRWQGGGDGNDIRCESADGRFRQCGTGLYGTATMVRQLSSTACRYNQNWGLRDGSIWVDGGCRGVFRVNRNNGGGNDSDYNVTCASANGRYTTCAWDRNRGWPIMIRQLSESPCIEGQSWGYDQRRGLWVDRGCRARFGVR